MTASSSNLDRGVLLDTSTIRSAAAALNVGDALYLSSTAKDMNIVALGHVVESILLMPYIRCVESKPLRQAASDISLHGTGLLRIFEIPEAFTQKLEKSSETLRLGEYFWSASGDTQCKVMELVGAATKVMTGAGYDFLNSCRKSAYQYLAGASDEDDDVLYAIHCLNQLDHRYQPPSPQTITHRMRHFGIGRNGVLPDDARKQISAQEMSDRILMSVYWLIKRATFYSSLSAAVNIPYFPSSLRSNLLALTNLAAASDFQKTGVAYIVKEIEESLNQVAHPLLRSSASGQFVSVQHPPFFQYVCNNVDNASEIIPYALEVRNTDRFLAMRQYLHDIESAIENGNNRELHKISRDFEKFSVDLCKWLKGTGITIQPTKFLRYFGIKMPMVDDYILSIDLPAALEKPYYPGKPHFALLRDLSADLLEVYSLGESYERLFN